MHFTDSSGKRGILSDGLIKAHPCRSRKYDSILHMAGIPACWFTYEDDGWMPNTTVYPLSGTEAFSEGFSAPADSVWYHFGTNVKFELYYLSEHGWNEPGMKNNQMNYVWISADDAESTLALRQAIYLHNATNKPDPEFEACRIDFAEEDWDGREVGARVRALVPSDKKRWRLYQTTFDAAGNEVKSHKIPWTMTAGAILLDPEAGHYNGKPNIYNVAICPPQRVYRNVSELDQGTGMKRTRLERMEGPPGIPAHLFTHGFQAKRVPIKPPWKGKGKTGGGGGEDRMRRW